MALDNEKNPVLGIDLGTTFSAIARWDGKGPRIYHNSQGDSTTQSVVYYDEKEDSYLVGKKAYSKSLITPDNGILGAKRLMDNKHRVVTLGTKRTNPVEVSSTILSALYGDVRRQFPEGVFDARGVVVSVPYYFRAHQCANTREAAELAGLNFMGIIQEPIAAALAYTLDLVTSNPDAEREETVLVFDLGGGTFDLTLFRLAHTRSKLLFEVLGTAGDDRLGGLDFDYRLREYIASTHAASLPDLDERSRKIAVQKLMEGANTTKESLSFDQTYNLVIPFLMSDLHLDVDVARKEFEQCIGDFVEKVRYIIDDTLSGCNVKRSDITRVIKVGGSSKIPIFHNMLADGIGSDRVYGNIDPSLCVAQGAAIYAAYLDDADVLGKEVEIIARNCHALGIETGDGGFFPLIPRNGILPYERTQIFTTDRDNMTELDVAVYQGSSKVAKENALVGTIHVKDLTPLPQGTLNIKISFRVNEEQRVSVSIEEPRSGIKIMETLSYA